jgi:hypothetical protein
MFCTLKKNIWRYDEKNEMSCSKIILVRHIATVDAYCFDYHAEMWTVMFENLQSVVKEKLTGKTGRCSNS